MAPTDFLLGLPEISSVTIRLEEKEAELLRAWLRERPEVHNSAELAVYSRRGVETGSCVYKLEPDIEMYSMFSMCYAISIDL